MGEIEQVPTLQLIEDDLPRLVELAKKAPMLQLDRLQRDQAHEAIHAHLTAIVGPWIPELRALEEVTPHDLDGLVSLTRSEETRVGVQRVSTWSTRGAL